MAHAVNMQDIPRSLIEGERLAPRGRTLQVAGLALLAVGAWLGWSGDQGFLMRAWLQGWLFAVSICLGGLFFTFIQHLTHAGWSVVVRRPAEALAGNLQWLWLGFVPIALLWWQDRLDVLFPWANLEHLKQVAPDEVAVVQKKVAYLNSGFFMIRAVVYLLVWAILARFFVGNSSAQDQDGSVDRTRRMERWAGPAAILFGLTTTFAAFDWIMSLNPAWFSTMFGVYFFAMSACGFFATIPIVLHLLQRAGKIENDVTKEHFQDLGKLLFGFGIVFHMYIAFSQFMLLWYANIPEATGWFLARTTGPWTALMWMLPIGHFAIPFVLLISKHAKRTVPFLCVICVWLLVMHFMDLYLAVMPEVPTKMLEKASGLTVWQAEVTPAELGWSPSLVDVTLVLGLLALMAGVTIRRMGRACLVPIRDPRLHEAVRFENM